MKFLLEFKKNKYYKLALTSLLNYNYYRKTRSFLLKTKSHTQEEIIKNQIIKIRDLLIYANNNVPYYTEVFKKEHISPEKFNSLNDITFIPFLDKELVRNNVEKLISLKASHKHLRKITSGGTTGMPINFYNDVRYSSPVEMAYIEFLWSRIGFRLYDKVLVLRGEHISVIEGQKYWRMNWMLNWLSMSSFHMNDSTIKLYAEKIDSFRPKYIMAYPSVALLLAKLYERNSLRPPSSIKALILSSESISKSHRSLIEKVFNSITFDHYGLSEKCCIAVENLQTGNYEFAPYYGFVELLNKNNQWCSKENERGEIVATGFHNYVFPFIRYRTNDIAISALNDNTGNAWFKIKCIEGRKQDFLIDKNNNLISFVCHDEPFYCLNDKVNAYQFIQNEPGKIKVLLECKSNFSSEDFEKLHKMLMEYYDHFDIQFEQTNMIEKTISGKFKFLIQSLPYKAIIIVWLFKVLLINPV